MAKKSDKKTALWAITENGKGLALKLSERLTGSELFLSESLVKESGKNGPLMDFTAFTGLKEEVTKVFKEFSAHVFFMATGIVVRLIAPCLVCKTKDPAVVVVDDRGNHAISLVSGHLGGANRLALEISEIIGAHPVITTATDVNGLPAIDLFAGENNLHIENPKNIKFINAAILKGEKIFIHDPERRVYGKTGYRNFEITGPDKLEKPGIFIGDTLTDLPDDVLVLRPSSLCAGIGCNRNTDMKEIKGLLMKVLEDNRLSGKSLECLASINIKKDETGICELAENLDLPVRYFDRDELNRVQEIQTPSLVVEKHVGVKSVCEAAAIKASKNGKLIVTKQKTENVTIAIARSSV